MPDHQAEDEPQTRAAWNKKGEGEEIIAENFGAELDTTNNRMELTAALAALKAFAKLEIPSRTITVFTDSQYVQKGMTSWLKSWKQNGWRTGDRKPVKNRDLWEQLDELSADFLIEWRWVRGHAGNEYNERCDRMTQQAIAFLQGDRGRRGIGGQRYLAF
jgi:ribonuclease HI